MDNTTTGMRTETLAERARRIMSVVEKNYRGGVLTDNTSSEWRRNFNLLLGVDAASAGRYVQITLLNQKNKKTKERVRELLIDMKTYQSIQVVDVLLDHVRENSTEEEFGKTLAGCAKAFMKEFISNKNDMVSYKGLEVMMTRYNLAGRDNFYRSNKNYINLVNSVALDAIDFDHPGRKELLERRREKLRDLYALGVGHGASHEHSYYCQHTQMLYASTLDEMCASYCSARFTQGETSQAILALLDTGAGWEGVEAGQAWEIIETHPRVIRHKLGRISHKGRAKEEGPKNKPAI